MGDQAIPALTIAQQRDASLEVRSRAAIILSRADEHRVLAPTLITLHMKQAPLRDVLASLIQQVKAPIAMCPFDYLTSPESLAKHVSIDVDRKPLLQVLAELARTANLKSASVRDDFNDDSDEDQTCLSADDQHPSDSWLGVACSHGSIHVTAQYAQRWEHLNLDKSKTRRQFQFLIGFDAEPKVRLLAVEGPLVLSEAIDDRGNNLLPATNDFPPEFRAFSGHSLGLFCPLEFPASPGQTIKTLRGTMRLRVQTRSETVRFSPVLNGGVDHVSQSVAGIVFNPGGLRLVREGLYELGVKVDGSRCDPDVWQAFLCGYAPQAYDAQGQKLARYRQSMASTPTSIDVVVRFGCRKPSAKRAGAGPPQSIEWEVPVKSSVINLPFEFHDLRMP